MAAKILARDVFINCPFDREYQPFLWAIVFAVIRSGFRARSALETDDSSENRIVKIQAIIETCRYGIHDISRTETDGEPPLPRDASSAWQSGYEAKVATARFPAVGRSSRSLPPSKTHCR